MAFEGITMCLPHLDPPADILPHARRGAERQGAEGRGEGTRGSGSSKESRARTVELCGARGAGSFAGTYGTEEARERGGRGGVGAPNPISTGV
eukprot:979825-Rhodomonas_salina.2